MEQAFRIEALDVNHFRHLFSADADALVRARAVWLTADAEPGYPCRVSLRDAALGERVLLVHYAHHNVASPYRSAGPIFLREQAVTATPPPNVIPEMLRHRLLSVRAYGRDSMLRSAEVMEGTGLEAGIETAFLDPAVDYLQLHNAGPGCFNCGVRRA